MSTPIASAARRAALINIVKRPEPSGYLHEPQNRRQRRLAAKKLRQAKQKRVGKT